MWGHSGEQVYEVMSVCRVRSLSLSSIVALPVEVEVDVGAGLPGFSIVGLPDAAVQEALVSALARSRPPRGLAEE